MSSSRACCHLALTRGGDLRAHVIQTAPYHEPLPTTCHCAWRAALHCMQVFCPFSGHPKSIAIYNTCGLSTVLWAPETDCNLQCMQIVYPSFGHPKPSSTSANAARLQAIPRRRPGQQIVAEMEEEKAQMRQQGVPMPRGGFVAGVS